MTAPPTPPTSPVPPAPPAAPAPSASPAPSAPRVAVVTGSRAEYGLLKPVLRALQGRVPLALVATGMHLDAEAGTTVQDILHDGFRVDARVPMQPATDDPADLARAVGHGVAGLADAFAALRPDVVLVLGDRHEALAAAVAAVYGGRILAHIHGGDLSAGLDEQARHAVTKLAHLHFAATPRSAQRILAMGEEPWRVHVVGAPGLDSVLHAPLPSLEQVRAGLGLPGGPFLLFVMHPETTDPARAADDVRAALEGTLAAGLPVVALGPNLDPGGRASGRWLRGQADRLVFRPSLPHEEYLALLHGCAVLVGNSSSGIIEAPAFGVPVVNVGPRQEGRERGDNVLDVPAEAAAVQAAVARCLTDAAFQARARQARSPYGDGRAGARIADVLAGLRIDLRLRRKHWVEAPGATRVEARP